MRTLTLLATGLLAACTCNEPGAGSLVRNASEAFGDCSAAEINFLAAKTGAQLAFAPCAANAFSSYTWSPDGRRVYFQLVFTAHVMDAEQAHKPIVALGVAKPAGPATWLTNERLAIPVQTEAPGQPLHLALATVPPLPALGAPLPEVSVELVPLGGLVRVVETQRGASEGELLLLGAETEGGPLRAWRYVVSEARLEPALPWLPDDASTLTWELTAGVVAVGRGDTVELRDLDDGAVVGTSTPARRGTLHPDGRWLVLEHLGDEVSVFAVPQRADVPAEVARREAARAAALAERLPAGLDTTVRPPELSIVDRTSGRRVRLTGFQGDRFAWYEASLPYATFFLWGFEGRQLRRNVALVDLGSHLAAVDEGRERMGQAPMVAGEVSPPADPADP